MVSGLGSSVSPLGDPCYPSAVRTLGSFVLLSFLVSLASCGGSSSETPPPLEPLPMNVHYSRAATALPGDVGTSRKAPASSSEALPAEPPEPPPAKAAPPPKSQF